MMSNKAMQACHWDRIAQITDRIFDEEEDSEVRSGMRLGVLYFVLVYLFDMFVLLLHIGWGSHACFMKTENLSHFL